MLLYIFIFNLYTYIVYHFLLLLNIITYHILLKYQYIKGLYYYSKGLHQDALDVFNAYEKELESTLPNIDIDTDKDGRLLIHDYVASLRWHSECLLSLAKESDGANYTDTIHEIDYFDKFHSFGVYYAERTNFQRAIAHSYIIQANAYLTLLDDRKKVLQLMDILEGYSSVIENDARYTKEYNDLRKRLSMR